MARIQKGASYAASVPHAPASSPVNPPNLVQLGSLSSLEIWDQSEPNGLATKYETSYSSGEPNAGTGVGTNYVPGNRTLVSQVIWCKESLITKKLPVPNSEGLIALLSASLGSRSTATSLSNTFLQ